MEAIIAEVERKRKELLASKQPAKYQRRGDSKVSETQVDLSQEKSKTVQSLKQNSNRSIQTSNYASPKKLSTEHEITLSTQEIEKRLRVLGEPIRLFNESDNQRSKRLNILSTKEERALHQNDFKQAWNSNDSDLQKTMFDSVKDKGNANNTNTGGGSRNGYDDLNNDNDDEDDERKSKRVIDMKLFRKITPELFEKDQAKVKVLIEGYLRFLLFEWNEFLKKRCEDLKNTATGKMLTTAYVNLLRIHIRIINHALHIVYHIIHLYVYIYISFICS